MCVHATDRLGVTGSADDVLSVFTITEMVSVSINNEITADN